MSIFEAVVNEPCPRCTCDEYTVTQGSNKIYYRCYFCGLWVDENQTIWFDSEEAEKSNRNIYKLDKKIPVVKDIRFT